MSKKIILGILSLLSVVTLVACGSSDKQLQDKVEKKREVSFSGESRLCSL